ncbi:uncharacterized protein PAC_01010 [Phialocephala subalpina]|uniref:BTB domain-containing protein n=1 Tax=Phialocephala subalpina TaxID=576137 RepID=A0A1L7WEC4_9HELO|nr:uncharacterized protein PAC_01010 [Phialocephala subalpina]
METPNASSEDAEKSRRSPKAERARKKARMDALTFSEPGSLVKLLVGQDNPPIELHIHKEVVCQRSPVFRAAFCGNFSEAQSHTYPLRHIDESTAKLLMQWLYTQKLVVAQLKDDWTEDAKLADEEDRTLIDLWVLADELQMPALQNTTIKAIHDVGEKTEMLMSNTNKERILNKTADGSQLRLYISHYIASTREPGDYK